MLMLVMIVLGHLRMPYRTQYARESFPFSSTPQEHHTDLQPHFIKCTDEKSQYLCVQYVTSITTIFLHRCRQSKRYMDHHRGKTVVGILINWNVPMGFSTQVSLPRTSLLWLLLFARLLSSVDCEDDTVVVEGAGVGMITRDIAITSPDRTRRRKLPREDRSRLLAEEGAAGKLAFVLVPVPMAAGDEALALESAVPVLMPSSSAATRSDGSPSALFAWSDRLLD